MLLSNNCGFIGRDQGSVGIGALGAGFGFSGPHSLADIPNRARRRPNTISCCPDCSRGRWTGALWRIVIRRELRYCFANRLFPSATGRVL